MLIDKSNAQKRRKQSKHYLGFFSVEILAIAASVIITGFLTFFILRHAFAKNSTRQAPTSQSNTSSAQDIPQSKRYWIMGMPVLNEVVTDPSARKALSHDTIFVPGKKGENLVAQAGGLHIIPVESFTSEAQLASAINSDSIDPSVKVLLYDNEDWSLTPTSEQANLLDFYKKAASIAHNHGYQLIGTPVSKTDPQADVQIAPYVDVLDIQSQYDQAVESSYAGHVLPLAQSARKANSRLTILSGLSTNPPAGIPTSQQLVNDAQAVSNTVQGYWLNIPAPGTACPKCNLPQPEIGIEFLSKLGSN